MKDVDELADLNVSGENVNRMKKILAPFFLRRLKSEVYTQLPRKREVVVKCEMTQSQAKAYRTAIQRTRGYWNRLLQDPKTAAQLSKNRGKFVLRTDDDDELAKRAAAEALAAAIKPKTSRRGRKPKAKVLTDEDGDEADGASIDAPIEDGEGELPEDLLAEAAEEAPLIATDSTDATDDSSSVKSEVEGEGDGQGDGGVVLKGREQSKLLNNIFMNLRKIANHLLLCQELFGDEDLMEIAQRAAVETDEFGKEMPSTIVEILKGESDFRIASLCMRMGMPVTIVDPITGLVDHSGKTKRLQELLEELKAGGHRVLLFSQMTRMLDILMAAMDRWGHSFVRLDGSTPVSERQAIIDSYNTDPVCLPSPSPFLSFCSFSLFHSL